MNQKISVLMDGELFEDEVPSCLVGIKQDAAARQDWAIYHLIGDVLRQPDYVTRDLSASVRDQMKDEPVVLAPRGYRVQQKSRNFALAIAATLAAVGVVSWMSLQIGPESNLPSVAQQSALRPASMQIKPSANEYLMAHQEFSPSTDMNGGASYIRMASYSAGVQ